MSLLGQLISKSNLKDLAADYGEIGVDKFITESDILKEIPVIKTLLSIYKITDNIQAAIFTKKMLMFLNEIKDIPNEKVLCEIGKIDASEKYQSKVGEKLIEVLQRVDSEKKPQLIGRLFKEFLLQKFEYAILLKLYHLVDKAFYYDLLALKGYDEYDFLYNQIEDDLYGIGLCAEIGIRGGWNGTEKEEKSHEATCTITKYGKLIAGCLD